MAGKLVICPTPIGNLDDMPPRALEALRTADVVCAEDTRVTGKLLAAFDIHTRLERLDENLMGERAAVVVERVRAGETIAYCSDAGMPGVSDPGQRLVDAALDAGVAVEENGEVKDGYRLEVVPDLDCADPDADRCAACPTPGA